jgi:thioredoxin-related protein
MIRIIRIAGILILLTSQVVVAQQNIQFIDGGLKKAIEQSKVVNKPVFFFCYASWCPHCKKMRENLFTDPSVADYLNQHFVCAQQDMEKGDGVEQHKTFDIKSYPTYIFIDSNGTVIYRLNGEFKSDDFLAEGRNALTPKLQLPYLAQKFEKDVSNPDNCLVYLRALKKGGMDYSEMVQKYFATQSDRQLLTEMNWLIIANGTTDVDSREFQYLLSHQKEFASIASRQRVERKIFYMVKEQLTPLVENNDTLQYFKKRSSASTIGLFDVDSLIFEYDITLYQVNADWNAYQKETLHSVEKYAVNNSSQLSDIANVYQKHISDTAALSIAVKWAEQSIALKENYDTFILCSKLYQKLRNNHKAILMAQSAKELAIKNGSDYSEADSLLNELK